MSLPIPKRSIATAGFWLRYFGYAIGAMGLGVAAIYIVGLWSEEWAVRVGRSFGLVALFGSWAMARELSEAEIEEWKRSNPEPPPVPKFYFRERGYIYGPYTLQELQKRFPNPVGVEVAADNGQSEKELKRGKWQDLASLLGQASPATTAPSASL